METKMYLLYGMLLGGITMIIIAIVIIRKVNTCKRLQIENRLIAFVDQIIEDLNDPTKKKLTYCIDERTILMNKVDMTSNLGSSNNIFGGCGPIMYNRYQFDIDYIVEGENPKIQIKLYYWRGGDKPIYQKIVFL